MLPEIIKAYLYHQYNDDDNIRAFFTVYNTLANEIYQWMVNANLPIFIGTYNSGDQLKWIAKGIYGQNPPILVSSKTTTTGPYGTAVFGGLIPFGEIKKITSSQQIVASDDLFKRIMTWNYYKGDGFHFTIPWLKRRVMRFLLGENGVDVANDEHWNVSVLFSSSGTAITIFKGYRIITGSAKYGAIPFGAMAFGQINTALIQSARFDYAQIFKETFDSGLLNMPFYSPVSVTIVG